MFNADPVKSKQRKEKKRGGEGTLEGDVVLSSTADSFLVSREKGKSAWRGSIIIYLSEIKE